VTIIGILVNQAMGAAGCLAKLTQAHQPKAGSATKQKGGALAPP
jgi:hypothetical protein